MGRKAAIFVLITAGTVGATFGIAKTDPNVKGWKTKVQIDPLLTGVSLLVLVGGVALRYVGRHPRDAQESGDGPSLRQFRDSLAEIITRVAELEQREANAPDDEDAGAALEALHRDLTDLIDGPVAAVIVNRQALVVAYGLAAFAKVMGPFAEGERYLHRAWSAAVDGYLRESRDSLCSARSALDECRDELAAIP